MVPLSYLLKLNLFPEKDVQPQNIKLSQSLVQFTTTIHTYIRLFHVSRGFSAKYVTNNKIQ